MEEGFAGLLRLNAERAGLAKVSAIASRAGVREVYRVTVEYDRVRYASVVVTLTCRGMDDIEAGAVYLGHFGNRPLLRRISSEQYESFTVAMRQTGFDRLPDQPGIPFYGADLWLVERAAGSFSKSVIIQPERAADAYAQVVALVRASLPEVARQLP